ncbi:MAG: response regulator, partial [Syntrophales bacterium LBB04]|nr:response regulator [Syntrophales bacterium LBB04]
ETILLIDDEDLVMEVGEKFLKVMGYRVLKASEGEEAVETYRNHQEEVDLIILDLIMPKMEGGEVFKRLRKISPEVKILLSSGYSLDAKVSQIIKQGACGFIQKPFDMEQLSQSIRAIFDDEKKMANMAGG